MPSREETAEHSSTKKTPSYSHVICKPLKLKGAKLEETYASDTKQKKHKNTLQQAAEAVVTREVPLTSQEIRKTAAEIAYEEKKRKRDAKLVKKEAGHSYRQKLEEYNKKVAALSEHNDIPKVGPG